MNKETIHIRALLIGVILVLSSNSYAQKKDTNPNGYNKFYYENGQLSSEGNLKNGKPEGYWKNYYESGILKSEGNRLDHQLDSTWKFYSEEGILREEINYKSGLRNGVTNTYSKEGFLEVTTPYRDDAKHGIVFTYYTNGGIHSETPFDNGKENGIAYEFNPKGDIITMKTYQNGILTRQENINRRDKEGQKEGVWKDFYDDRVVKTEGRYRNDLKDGYWKEYSRKGELLQTLKYQDGELVTDAEELSDLDVKENYYEDSDGKLKFRGTYRNGKPHGTHLWYNEDGSIDSSKVYKDGHLIAEGRMDADGLRQGFWKEYYYPTGELKAEGEYKDGYRFNEWIYYFISGKMEQKGQYGEKEKPDGKWTWFYENTQLLREETFRNGKEHGWLIEYNDTGKVITRGEFVDGKEEGDWLYEIGDHLEQGKYEAGMRQGGWKHYYLSNGELRFEGEFFEDLPEGKHTWYFDSGRKMLEGNYVSGVQEGEWRRYYEDGTLMLSIDYQQGVEVKVDGLKIKEVKVEEEGGEG